MKERTQEDLPRLNLRPFFVAAVGLIGGIFLCYRIMASAFRIADAIVFFLFFALLLPPFAWRRALLVLAVFSLAAGLGAGLFSLACGAFSAGAPGGGYTVTGTVERVAVSDGYAEVTLRGLTLDGEKADGKLTATLPGESVRPGDVVTFFANVSRNKGPTEGGNLSDLAANVRYAASPAAYTVVGVSSDLFLCANAALYNVLYGTMERDAAGVAYALLTGNSSNMDGGLLRETRTGGIAHVFAVSGLHIGILYGAAVLLCKPFLRRWSFLPALLLAGCYSALCAFTVSSVRAVVMCGVAGAARFAGRKYDLLSSLSFAAVLTLLAAPAQLFSVSFQLSYGAVAGLALFSGSFARGLRRLHFPVWLAQALASSIAVQTFTLPLMLTAFGYLSVWGTFLNLFVIPALPVLFLPLIVCGFLSALLPAAAPVLLALPEGLLSALLFLFSAADFSAVLAGFALGAGTVVWFAAMLLLSEKVRLGAAARGVAAAALACSFALAVCAENVVFAGCRIDVSGRAGGDCALVRADGYAVLVLDGDASLSLCEDLLSRTYGGELDAVFVAAADEARAVNVAAFLDAPVYTFGETETGLRDTPVYAVRRTELGGMTFTYEREGVLVMTAEGVSVQFCFEGGTQFAEFALQEGETRLKYLVKDGIIRSL